MIENCRKVEEERGRMYQELGADLKLLELELKELKREKKNCDSGMFQMSAKEAIWKVSINVLKIFSQCKH